MEKQQNNALVRPRSFRRIIADSFSHYSRSFVPLVRAVWMPARASALTSIAVALLLAADRYLLLPLVGLALLFELTTWLRAGCWLSARPLRQLLRTSASLWPQLLLTALAGLLLLAPVCLVAALPLLIQLLGHLASLNGMAMGDALHMPAYMPYLTAAVWLLCVLLQIYIRLYIVFVAYYACGSAEAKRRERHQQQLILTTS